MTSRLGTGLSKSFFYGVRFLTGRAWFYNRSRLAARGCRGRSPGRREAADPDRRAADPDRRAADPDRRAADSNLFRRETEGHRHRASQRAA